jgi:hypothetical protein
MNPGMSLRSEPYPQKINLPAELSSVPVYKDK